MNQEAQVHIVISVNNDATDVSMLIGFIVVTLLVKCGSIMFASSSNSCYDLGCFRTNERSITCNHSFEYAN